MTNLHELPNDIESLKQLVIERNATLEAMGRALHEVQLHLDHMVLLDCSDSRYTQPRAFG
jgi:hypothetical protein